jgi:hypothetical protein
MSFDFTATRIQNLAIHRVGNSLREEGYFLSKQLTDVRDNQAHDLLLQFFTHPFSKPEFFQFTHPTDVANNDLFKISERAFQKRTDFLDLSADIAKLLYSKSSHPKVNGGELYVVHFMDMVHEDESINALGIFKSESKTPFMKVLHKADMYDYEFDEGINLHAIDKACIIMNTSAEDGYRVCIHDRQGKGEEALYWKHDFLGLKPCADNYNKTRQFMSLCKDYIKDRLPQEFEVEKTDQIDLLNKSVAFFKANEQFEYESFTREVIKEPHIMKAFGKFKDEFEERNELQIGNAFEISESAVKSQARVFKSVLKLDRNFHVYVHGNREFIEKGYDEQRGMNFYKIFFKEES